MPTILHCHLDRLGRVQTVLGGHPGLSLESIEELKTCQMADLVLVVAVRVE